jgi:hypothetical protein
MCIRAACAIVVMAVFVVGVPSVPPAFGANARALQQRLSAAAGLPNPPVLTIEAGNYVFSNNSCLITRANNLVIEAHNVTFTFYYGFGLEIVTSHNLTIRGLTLDSDPPNYAQGRTTRLINATSFEAMFDDQFIPPDTTIQPFSHAGGLSGAKLTFWDAQTRRVLPGVNVNFMVSSEDLGGGNWKIGLKNPVAVAKIPEGSLVTTFPRRGFTWNCLNSSKVVAEDVTIHAGGNMGFHEQFGEGGHVYRRVAIVRKPGSKGLMALNADGFHSSDVGTGPTLVDSEISFTGDDFVNIHNRMLVVCKQLDGLDDSDLDGSHNRTAAAISSSSAAASSSSTAATTSLVIIDVSGGNGPGTLTSLRTGDEITFFQLMPGHVTTANPLLGAGVVTGSATRLTDPALVKECRAASTAMQQPPYNAFLVVNTNAARIYKVDFPAGSLAPAITASQYNLANFERRSGAGAVVERNFFHDACGSGGRIIAKALNGTYTDNTAERFGGFHVYSEPEWFEGDLGIKNVYLRNNTFVDQRGEGTHIDVMKGLVNITCVGTTFVEEGETTHRASGC